jgi:CelD/BcsL family acetyltransferase involved in cellulose biosynthesis
VAAPSSESPLRLDLDDPRWLDLVERHPDALAFHRPGWAHVLAESYGYRPFVLALEDSDGSLAAGVPVAEVRGPLGRRRWISLPFTDLCPPLVHEGDGRELPSALDRARTESGIGQLEVRAALPGVPARAEAVIHTLALQPDADAVFATFHRSRVQRNVRRSEREGVTVRRGESEADLARVFYALHVQTRRRLGVPVQPRRFFSLLWRHVLRPGHGHVLVAEADGRAIAAALFLAGGRTLTYKYGASDSQLWRLRPNHALLWSAIRTACADGYERFDFGRTDFEDTGLREFKSGWGGVEEPLEYSTLGAASAAGRKEGAGTAARGLLRRSPAWVCRAAGELLYRYAA